MSLKALLFDLDGTLVDSDPRHFDAFLAVASRHGVTFDRAFFQKHMSGHSNAQICATLFPRMSVEDHQRIADEKEILFRSMLDDVSGIGGLEKLVGGAFDRGLRLGVVSNAPRENVEAVIKALGIEEKFAVLIFGGLVAKGKPDPMPYREALVRLGVAAEEAVAFEDTPLGISSAVGAGIPTVGLTTTQSPEALCKAGASVAVQDYHDPALCDFLTSRDAA
jgi:beta-phosphoglucomutase